MYAERCLACSSTLGTLAHPMRCSSLCPFMLSLHSLWSVHCGLSTNYHVPSSSQTLTDAHRQTLVLHGSPGLAWLSRSDLQAAGLMYADFGSSFGYSTAVVAIA